MYVKMKSLNQKGFSLIELMVVVAIIAILASFAIPQYQSFQAKSRQKEGMTLVNSFFVAAKATEAESGTLWGNFVSLGFSPTGLLHYRVTMGGGGTNPLPATGIPAQAACINTIVASCTAPFRQWTEALVATSPSFYAFTAAPTGCVPAIASAAGTFTTCAAGVIKGQLPVVADVWRITNLKVLDSTSIGL